jgi:hypothetical protein
MVKSEVISLFEDNRIPKIEDLDQLKILSLQYPYFQAIQAVYLKALKYYHKIDYNEQIKRTAAITVDRNVLFEYITLDLARIEKREATTIQLEGIPSETVEESVELNSDSNPSIEEKVIKENSSEKEALIDVLEFNRNDAYSFNEWLQLSAKPKTKKSLVKDEKGELISQNETNNSKDGKQENQRDLIDSFLSSNPKMPRPNPNLPSAPVVDQKISEEELMTETLAKVYLAQKKFDKAIFAYRILSLKNPEKSGLFADQIRKIEQIKKNK